MNNRQDDQVYNNQTHQRILAWRQSSAQHTPTQPSDETMADLPTPSETPADPHVAMTISFRDANGSAVDFKMKRTTKLGKAMTAFAGRAGHDPKQLRFLFDGDRITEEDTPESLTMEEGDSIEVHMEQIGGGMPRALLKDGGKDGGEEEWMLIDFHGDDDFSQRTEREVERSRVSNLKRAKRAKTLEGEVAAAAEDSIKLTIKDNDGKTITYQMRPSTRLNKAFRKFAESTGGSGFPEDRLDFMYEGKKLEGDEAAIVFKPAEHVTVDAVKK